MSRDTPGQVGLGCIRNVAEQALGKQASKQPASLSIASVPALRPCPGLSQRWIFTWNCNPNKPFPFSHDVLSEQQKVKWDK